MVIEEVDFDEVTREAVAAVRLIATDGWDELADIIENIGQGLSNDIAFVARKKKSGEFDEVDARVFMEDQKIIARMRLRSVAIVTLKTAEEMWNAIAEVFNAAIKRAIGWTIL